MRGVTVSSRDVEMNKASTEALVDSGLRLEVAKESLRGLDMLIVRGTFPNRGLSRRSVSKLEQALRRANPGWKGVIVHLPEGVDLQQMPAAMVERLYETLMGQWDPDLLEQRREARRKSEEASNLAKAEEAHRHLENVVQSRKKGD